MICLAAIGALIVVPLSASAAPVAGSSFADPTAPGFTLIGTPSPTTNSACLTASSDTAQTPIPGCSSPAIDAAGSGALRLTSAANSEVGAVTSTTAFPLAQGLDVRFDSYQYGGAAGANADGIGFYLAVTDPNNPSYPADSGQFGRSLGYSAGSGQSGLDHAYLGIGLDSWGNFVTTGADGTGCTTTYSRPDTFQRDTAVTIRGPGNGTVGYCVLQTTYTNTRPAPFTLSGTTRSDSLVPVEVVLNPGATPITSNGGMTVAPDSYLVSFQPLGGSVQTLTGTLPVIDATNFPAGWFDASGHPYKLTFGWTASTGGKVDVHEVVFTDATTNAPIPVLSTTVSGGALALGSTNNPYTITPTVQSSGAAETNPVVVTTTFPSGTTPHLPAAGSPWTCTISGQTVTCSYPASTASPIPAGTTLPSLVIPVDVPGPVAQSSVSYTLSSVGAVAVTGSGPTNIYSFTANTGGITTAQNASWTRSVGQLAASAGAPLDTSFVPTVPSSGAGAPAHGTVTASAGSVTYTPDAGYSGSDSFALTVCDTGNPVACGPVTIATTVSDNTVTASPDSASVVAGNPTTIDVLSNDTSASGQALRHPVAIVTAPPSSEGTVVANPDGTVTFSPARGFIGTSAFSYRACDTSTGNGPFCATGTVSVSVTAAALAYTGLRNPLLVPVGTAAGAGLVGLLLVFFAARRRGRHVAR